MKTVSVGLSIAVLMAGCNGTGDDTRSSRRSALTCTAAPPGLFDYALCLCDSYHDVGKGLIATSSSVLVANVGVNKTAHTVGNHEVSGSMIAYLGMSGVGDITTGKDLVSTQDVNGVGDLSVGGDAIVGGDLRSVGGITVAGNLRVQGDTQVVGQKKVGGLGSYVAPAGPPCGCDGSTFFDVAKAVDLAKTNNDNGSLPTGTLENVGDQTVELAKGRYFISGARVVGDTVFHVTDDAALYVDGDLNSVGDAQFQLAANASLDLYVKGSVRTVGNVTTAGGKSFRLFVGGSNPIIAGVGDQQWTGSIYAPRAEIRWVGNTHVNGAIFGNTLQSVGKLKIDYAKPNGAQVPDVCVEEGGADAGTSTPPSGGTEPDAGTIN